MSNIENSKNINTGTVNAGSVRFGDEIHVHPQNVAPKYLTSKPFSAEVILGRDDDLDKIKECLWNNNHLLLLVNGEGGIGKTTLASHYWHSNEANYKHLGWIFAGDGILRGLLSMADKLKIEFQSSMNVEDRLEVFLQYLSNLEDPSLLVLDNANDIEDLQKYYKNLKSLTNFHILVTSRVNELSNITTFPVGSLDLETSIELFKTYYKNIIKEEETLLESIFIAVGFNTLVIELLAKNLRQLNKFTSNYSLQDLLKSLQENGLLQIKTKSVQTTYGSNELQTAKPEDIIKAMYNLAPLSYSQINLLCVLSILPPESIDYKILISLYNPINKDQFEDDLYNLYQKGWLDLNEENNFIKCSPVIQAIIKDANKERLLEHTHNFVANLNNSFTIIDFKELSTHVAFASSVSRSLKERTQLLALINYNISGYYHTKGNIPLAMEFIQESKNIFEYLGDKKALAECIRQIGRLYNDQGKQREAIESFDESLGLYGDENSLETISVNINKINLLNSQGRSEEALKLAQQELNNIKKLNNDFPNNQNIITVLASVHESIAEIKQKIRPLHEALEEFVKMHDCFVHLMNLSNDNYYRTGIGLSLSKIGIIYREMGDIPRALSLFVNSNRIMEEVYIKNPDSEFNQQNYARSTDLLARMYENTDSLKAEKLLKKFNSLCKTTHENNPISELSKFGYAISFDRLGNFYMHKNQLEEATTNFLRYNQLNSEMFSNNSSSELLKLAVAISNNRLGEVNSRKHEYATALDYYKEYNKIALELIVKNPSSIEIEDHIANSYAQIGYQCKKLGLYEEARTHYIKSLEIWGHLCKKTGQPRYCENLANVKRDISSI
ncbi:tetratricopeptide repeat protein [Spirosoma oryzicola]|uniref:tetratricopeptide repeat protein n=1 Tax=Spirosoma oryzicola TaxID=2898794 RepID=UPI001E4AE536|nr:tetratricopeptide repeat protein [Spirosoma oryzicola]UHG91757.1 NB-ARC domain-containing protein [Spirosoma oryzicola]